MTEATIPQMQRQLSEARAAQSEAEKQRQDCEERLRLFKMASDDPTWDWNILTGEVDRNNAAAAFFGDNSPIENRSIKWWQHHIHPEDRDRVLAVFADAIAAGRTTVSAEYRFRNADGTFAHIYDSGSIMHDVNGIAVRAVGTRVDLTALLRGQEALAQSEAKLVHAARHSAMGTMASMIAHELNQPLAAIANYVRASRRIAAKGDDTARRDFDGALIAAEENALRAGEVVHRLRELVRRGHVERHPQSVASLVDRASTIALLDAEAENIRCDLNIAEALPDVSVDAVQIQQVLINLVRNAIEAFADPVDRLIIIAARATGEFIEISVSDNGPGIEEDAVQNLFAAQISHKELGMGIGLSICRTIIEAHGGRIWLAENRTGADFRFTLPIAAISVSGPPFRQKRRQLRALESAVRRRRQQSRKPLNRPLVPLTIIGRNVAAAHNHEQ